MNIGLYRRLFGLVLFCVLAWIPLEAQDWTLYAGLSTDGYGNMYGMSAVDIGDDFPNWEAYVQGEIDGPSGTYAAGPGFDNGFGYAEVDLIAAADLDGYYFEVTDGSMDSAVGEYYIGELDSYDVAYSGDCVPLGEYSTFLQFDSIGGFGYGADFRATLTGGQFQGDQLEETINVTSQSCAIPYKTMYAPISGAITGMSPLVSPNNTYVDIVGYAAAYVPNYYQFLIDGVEQPIGGGPRRIRAATSTSTSN